LGRYQRWPEPSTVDPREKIAAKLPGFATYSVPGGTQQETVPSGWSLDVGYTDFGYISVQNDSDFGSVTCVLIRNGVVIVQNTSNGAYAIATCHDPY
jgi:hypothetical protein